MKSIKHILKSYMQLEFIHLFNFGIGICWWIVANIKLFRNQTMDEGIFSAWFMFVLAVIFPVPIVITQIRRLLLNSTGLVIPGYFRKQLIAGGILLFPFILYPPIAAAFSGFPALNCLAMLLFLTALLAWIVSLLPENLVILIILIWPASIVYELLGFETILSGIDSFSELTGIGNEILFPALVAGLSAAAIYFYIRVFLKLAVYENNRKYEINLDSFSSNYDRMYFFTSIDVLHNLKRITARGRERLKPAILLIRKFQYGLFSPGKTVISSQLILTSLTVLAAAGMITFINQEWRENFNKYLFPAIFLFYHISGVLLTTDFLQHRDRMPALWMISGVSSRKKFLNMVIVTFLMVALKNYIVFSVPLTIITGLVMKITYLEILRFLLSGLILYIILVSLSLILSEDVTSHNCRGWMLPNMLSIFPIMILNLEIYRASTQQIWTFMMVTAVIGILLFFQAFRSFGNTEMSFVGPEYSL